MIVPNVPLPIKNKDGLEMFRIYQSYSALQLSKKSTNLSIWEADNKGRTVEKNLNVPLTLFGIIKAGYPTDEEEQDLDRFTVNEYLVDEPQSSYLLRVSGDSMIDAGIYDGDIVVVDTTKDAKVGDIVVALVDRELTLKFLQKENGKHCLQPGNAKYPTIYPKNDLKIEGVVTSVMRKYS